MKNHEKKDDENERKGVGKALRRAVGYEELEEDYNTARGKVSILMNETRQRIFQFLSDRPCAHLRLVARSLDISTPTADWHLKKLIRRGFVGRQRIGKKKIYYPKGLLSSTDITIFTLLNSDLTRRIISELKQNPGLSQKEIKERVGRGAVSRCLSKMRDAGILSPIKSGRYIHYYLNKDLLERDKHQARRIRQFRKDLLKKLADDGLSPKIMKAREKSIKIKVRSGADERILIIHTKPFSFVLSNI